MDSLCFFREILYRPHQALWPFVFGMFEVKGERLLRSKLRKKLACACWETVGNGTRVFLLARAESGLFASCAPGSTTTSLVASRADLLVVYAELFECLIRAKKLVWKNLGEPTGNKGISLPPGGLVVASPFLRPSKTNVDKLLITRMARTKPSQVLLFASVDQPILRTLPPGSAFALCLILGIAPAANVGRQSSLISPHKLITLNAMDPRLNWA
ncbi:hypothetical protein F5887DRAFT_1159663 [Amanita rubescens]|nr:hypothetical protein F5887DRAFT_1159663 [Amanita rubescens]